MVLLAIIAAGIAAKTLTGEYTYFGQLKEPAPISILTVLPVAVISGMGGAIFSILLVPPDN